MRFRSHSNAVCRQCRRESVLFGMKTEPTGWKVHCVCSRTEECGHEWTAGWVSMSRVDSFDEAIRRAEQLR